MTDALSDLKPEVVVAVVVLALIVVVGIVSITAIIAVQWRKQRAVEMLANLKRDLAASGMSAQDIERTINAGQLTSGQRVIRGLLGGD